MADMGLIGMGGAAGAGDALQTLFKQRMEQAQMAQQADQFNRSLAQQDALTRLKAQENAEAIRQRVENTKQAEADRAEARRQSNLTMMSTQLNEIPTDTPISGATQGAMTKAGITPERFAPTPITADVPPSIAAPDQPNTTGVPGGLPGTMANSPAPNLVSFHRIPTAQELEKQREDAAKAAAQRNPIAEHAANRAFDVAHPLPHEAPTVVVQTVDDSGNPITKIVPKTAGSQFERSTPQTDRQRKMAEFAAGDVTAALDQVDAAEKAGLLGPGSGRLYGQFLAGTVGSTGDAKIDAQLGGLKAAIKDLNTSYPMAISGTARAGGGAGDRLKEVLNSDKFSADLMRGALHEIAGALARRANAPAAGTKPKLSAEELIKKYGG